MTDHVTSRRKFRRRYAMASFWLASGLTAYIAGASVFIDGAATALQQVAIMLGASIATLYGLFGWYMKVGHDENKIAMENGHGGAS